MKNQIDRTLINTLSELARKERKVKEFKSRIRVKGKLIKKGKTKKGSIKLIIQKGEDNTILWSSKCIRKLCYGRAAKNRLFCFGCWCKQIKELDDRTDQEAYKIYGLTKDEIRIVEGSLK